uniref:DJ-1/PfpI domain-containing protein n=1 Tax=Panagrolaimus sp. PS1159 TaxID=55785 RepID=A0AC35GRZ9_9BILA
MASKILVIGFPETEETELIITVDVLRRAELNVIIANLNDEEYFTCVQKTKIKADKLFKDVENDMFDAVIIPGGPGSYKVANNERLVNFIKNHDKAGKFLGAICGAPVIFAQNKIGEGGKMTSYPKDQEKIEKAGYVYDKLDVVVSNNIITSRAPGTAFEFALKLVEILVGETTSMELAKTLLYVQ